jgi:hypothetical protein
MENAKKEAKRLLASADADYEGLHADWLEGITNSDVFLEKLYGTWAKYLIALILMGEEESTLKLEDAKSYDSIANASKKLIGLTHEARKVCPDLPTPPVFPIDYASVFTAGTALDGLNMVKRKTTDFVKNHSQVGQDALKEKTPRTFYSEAEDDFEWICTHIQPSKDQPISDMIRKGRAACEAYLKHILSLKYNEEGELLPDDIKNCHSFTKLRHLIKESDPEFYSLVQWSKVLPLNGYDEEYFQSGLCCRDDIPIVWAGVNAARGMVVKYCCVKDLPMEGSFSEREPTEEERE